MIIPEVQHGLVMDSHKTLFEEKENVILELNNSNVL